MCRFRAGLSVLTADADGFDHSIVIETKDPHSLASSCPAGVSPCLADGSLRVLLDGEETLLAPGTVALGSDVEVSAVNLPGACRSFGFEKVGLATQVKPNGQSTACVLYVASPASHSASSMCACGICRWSPHDLACVPRPWLGVVNAVRYWAAALYFILPLGVHSPGSHRTALCQPSVG